MRNALCRKVALSSLFLVLAASSCGPKYQWTKIMVPGKATGEVTGWIRHPRGHG